ncbi:MAG: SEL1-like repeat protein [Spirochaetaceae bacterium]|nr:SEL1-like repeat protein [Spirochaetaceae bacterium]
MIFVKKTLLLILCFFLCFSLFSQNKPLKKTPKLTPEQIAKYPADKWFTAERPDYSELDERVRTLAKNEETPEAVARIVCEGLETDIEKARAIFDWLAFNVAYDTTYAVYRGKEAFKKRIGVCQGYAELFTIMAKEVGLSSEMIVGLGYGFNRDGHAWNVVKLEDRDILLDCCWGAGGILRGKFIYDYKPEWFDTHPALFALRHLPAEQDDLRVYPFLSKDNWNRLPYCEPDKYWPYGDLDPVQFYSYRFCGSKPNLPVTFRSPRSKNLYFNYVSTGPDLLDGFFMMEYEKTLYNFGNAKDFEPVRGTAFQNTNFSAASDIPLRTIAEYCNIMSPLYGLEECYTITDEKIECDYSKCGFRLPTKKEWLAACGTRYLDSTMSEKEFADAVWYDKNSGGRIIFVEETKPNENHIFDMLGNVSELCWDEETGQYVFMGGNIFSTREQIQALEPVPFDNYAKNKGAHGFRLVVGTPKTTESQLTIGKLYQLDSLFAKNRNYSREWLKLAVEGNNVDAMAWLAGTYLSTNSSPEELKMRYELCMKAAESEQDYALSQLGLMYSLGIHVEKDKLKAFEYYERSAKVGNTNAMYQTSQFYKEGDVIPRDFDKYFYWLKNSIDNGYSDEDANLEFVDCYRDGTGCEKDERKAYNMCKKLADKKNAGEKTLIHFAEYCEQGIGCTRDMWGALMTYRKAEDKGSSLAMARIADFSFYGKDRKHDIESALKQYKAIVESSFENQIFYGETYEYICKTKEAFDSYGEEGKTLLARLPYGADPGRFIELAEKINAVYKENLDCQMTNPVLFADFAPEIAEKKFYEPLKKIEAGEKLAGKTLVVLLPVKESKLSALAKKTFEESCFTEKKYKVNKEYYNYDQSYFEYYDNIILLQQASSKDFKDLDKEFEVLQPALKNCSEVDFLTYTTDLFKTSSPYVESLKQIILDQIAKDNRPRILALGNQTDVIQSQMNKFFTEEEIAKINVFGTPCTMQGEIGCGFRKGKLFVVLFTDRVNGRYLLIYLDETGWAPEPTRADTTFAQSQQNLNKMTALGINKSGTITKPGKMVMHYKVFN